MTRVHILKKDSFICLEARETKPEDGFEGESETGPAHVLDIEIRSWPASAFTASWKVSTFIFLCNHTNSMASNGSLIICQWTEIFRIYTLENLPTVINYRNAK